MKYRALADTPEEEAALQARTLPMADIDTLAAMVQSRAIMASVQLGVFESMAGRECSSAEIAQSCDLDPECTELLLRVLACASYVQKTGDGYRLTDMAADTMLAAAPRSLVATTKLKYALWSALGQLESVLRAGKGIGIYRLQNEATWRTQVRSMSEIMRFEGPVCASLVPVKAGAHRMLDLGGSHGFLGALLCERHAGLHSEVIDLPSSIRHARPLAKELGIDDVVTFREGDILEDEFGCDVDLIMLANVAHHLTVDQNRRIVAKSFSSLSPGGSFATWEIDRSAQGGADIYGDAYALAFRLMSTSRLFSGEEHAAWLQSAGFVQIEVVRPPSLPGGVLISGIKPCV